jgi:FAD:protein FMN transferase
MRSRINVRRMRPALGTWVEISASAATERRTVRAIDAAYKAIEQVQLRFSIFDAQSELSQINQRAFASPVAISAEANALLTFALDLAKSSDGAFNPTAGTQLKLRDAPVEPCSQLDNDANWRDVELINHEIRFHKRLLLDLGGIAKGYAIDLAIDALVANGCTNGVVNAGGDLRCFGPAAGKGLAVHLRDPISGQLSNESVPVHNQAFATSGGLLSARRSGGRLKTCLVGDKRINWRQTSVSVLADKAVVADALTKVMLFANGSIRTQHAAQFSAQVFYLRSAAN